MPGLMNGITDYCVIGKIEVQALRKFQSISHSPNSLLNPVPVRFEIDFGCKVSPAGEKE